MAYRFGLDIGIASCGWSILDLQKGRIVDFGVRIFETAEMPKTGESLNVPRRDARGQRRRLRRRALRMEDIRALFVKAGLFTSSDAFLEKMNMVHEKEHSVWKLRAQALDTLLEPWEWTRVLIHLAKRRGYRSNRRVEQVAETAQKQAEDQKTDKKAAEESKQVSRGIALLREKQHEGAYRTVGETIAKHAAYAKYKRNRHGNHQYHMDRTMVHEEAQLLFASQRHFGNPYASLELEEQYMDIAFRQRPFASRATLERLIGKCTFEKNENRAPKHSYSSERAVMLQKINNLRLVQDGKIRSTPDENGNAMYLTATQRHTLIALVLDQKEVTYKSIRKALQLPDTVTFHGITYPTKKADNTTKTKKKDDPETAVVMRMKFYHAVKSALATDHPSTWQSLVEQPAMFDALGDILTLCKNDDELEDGMRQLCFDDSAIVALKPLNFSKPANLSYKAYAKLLPFLENGLTYDKACAQAGYDFRDQTHVKHRLLPPIPTDEVRNPVVLRALTQARKVLNAMVRTYGTPEAVHIEVARELSKPFDERGKIKKKIEENREKNQKVKDDLKNNFPLFKNRDAKPFDAMKYKLYKEQNCKCVYSGETIDLDRLFEPKETGYVEVDHILPMSRTMDDSYMNKVLVLQRENRNKGNRTPYEWFGDNTEKWAWFEGFVDNLPYKKRMNLLRKSLNQEEKKDFMSRHLNDTRYIARFFTNFVRNHLIIENNKVVCVNGQLTAFLRTHYGLKKLKDRTEDVHHALDAILIAVADEKKMHRISIHHKRKELYGTKVNEHVIDPETGGILEDTYLITQYDRDERFPLPWNDFRKEVLCRFGIDPRKEKTGEQAPEKSALTPWELLDQCSLSQYHEITEQEKKWIRPLFVSRAPTRKINGKAHEDTVKGLRWRDTKEIKVKKTTLSSIVGEHKTFSPKDAQAKVEAIYGEDPKLKEAVYAWLVGTADLKKAIQNGQYPRKPLKEGREGLGPEIRSVKLIEPSLAGVRVHQGRGIAENDAMVRVDIFEKKGKYYIVPIYVADTVKATLPERAIAAHKPETEWTMMDVSYRFCFSLYPNDVVRLQTKESVYFGYYKTTHRGSAGISILSHDRSSGKKEGRWEGLGIKTGVVSFDKYVVDVLGNYSLVKGERRLGFSERSHQ